MSPGYTSNKTISDIEVSIEVEEEHVMIEDRGTSDQYVFTDTAYLTESHRSSKVW